MGFYKDIRLDNLDSNMILTVDENKIIKTTNIPVSNIHNMETNISDISSRVTNLEGLTDSIHARLVNINGNNSIQE